MSSETPFNVPPEIVAMREDVASRAFNIKLIGGLISVGLMIGPWC